VELRLQPKPLVQLLPFAAEHGPVLGTLSSHPQVGWSLFGCLLPTGKIPKLIVFCAFSESNFFNLFNCFYCIYLYISLYNRAGYPLFTHPNTHAPSRSPLFWATCMALALMCFHQRPFWSCGTVMPLEWKTSKHGNPNKT
jgi:hypothetical protein